MISLLAFALAALVGFLLGIYARGRATVSDVCDLVDPRTGRHQNAKVVSLGAALGTFILLLIIVGADRAVSWPLAALIAAFFFGPLTVDVVKALAKIRREPPA